MANTAITNTALERDKGVEFTLNAATEDTVSKAEVFDYTPTGKPNKVCFGFQVANSNGTVKIKFAKSPGVFGVADLTIDAVENKTTCIQVEHGRYVQADGTFTITATPATGKKLLTDHALKIFAIELI